MFSKVPSCAFSGFWTLTLKLTQHFDLIYNIGKSDWNILRNIMKTAQDSYIITIKQIVRFQERMHLEKFQVDKIQNGHLSAIIHLDRPDIAEYHENRSRKLHPYYKTNCKVSGEDNVSFSGEDAPCNFLTLSNSKWPTIGIIYLDRPDIR